MTLSSIEPDQRDEKAERSANERINAAARSSGFAQCGPRGHPKGQSRTTTSQTPSPAIWRGGQFVAAAGNRQRQDQQRRRRERDPAFGGLARNRSGSRWPR